MTTEHDCNHEELFKHNEERFTAHQKRLTEGEKIFQEIKSTQSQHTHILESIDAQTKKTNGRLLVLEDKDIQRQIVEAKASVRAELAYSPMKLARDIIFFFGGFYTLLRIFGG